MTTHSKQAEAGQLQRLSEESGTLLRSRKRQSEHGRNVVSRAEMTLPQTIEFIRKSHWEDNKSLRDIAKELVRSYWWIIHFTRRNKITVKTKSQSLKDKYGGHCPNWRGGTYRHFYWMVFAPEHPNAGKRGYVAEHRMVMSKILGRPLREDEVVHHKDGNKYNNTPENLQLMSKGGRGKYHGIPLCCPQCGHELAQESLSNT